MRKVGSSGRFLCPLWGQFGQEWLVHAELVETVRVMGTPAEDRQRQTEILPLSFFDTELDYLKSAAVYN